MRLYIAGINGMVGSAIAIEARLQGFQVLGKTSKELDLTDRAAVFTELQITKPDALVIAAAKVGGIGANSAQPVDFLSINLQIQTNLLDAAHAANITRVLFLGSSCIYPKLAPQPITESALLTGELEPTNEPYAIAKIAGLKLVEGYRRQYMHRWISTMPTNLYGPRDNFDLESAHVLPALIHRFYNAKREGAKSVTIWGDGTPLREFLHVEDLARACLMLADNYDDSVAINVGSGQEISKEFGALQDFVLASRVGNQLAQKTRCTRSQVIQSGPEPMALMACRLNSGGWPYLLAVGLSEGIVRVAEGPPR
jgi:GDP-L-fucose synthase